ncbi:MAG: hypothetical protein RL648_211 [Verrucomicrobiota bacterium]
MTKTEFASRWSRYASGKVGLGCWALGGKHWGGQSDKAARAVLEEAWEAGYRHFDTASSYGFSERLLGRFLQTVSGGCLVASKVYPGSCAGRIRETLSRSLERLQLARIDLYYLHWPGGGAIERDVEQLAQSVEEGLVGAIGISNYTAEQVRAACSVASVAVYQGPYNLIWRSAEDSILPVCQELGIPFVGYGGLAEGLLSRTEVPPAFPHGDHRSRSSFFAAEHRESVEAFLTDFGNESTLAGTPPAQTALKWALQRPGVSAVLAGARRVGQAEQNKAAEQMVLSPPAHDRITALSDAVSAMWQGRLHYFGEHD